MGTRPGVVPSAAGDQRVITVLRYSGREKRTGIEVPPEYFAVVNEVRNGKMVTGREYATREEALEAAGLRESVFRCSPAAHCATALRKNAGARHCVAMSEYGGAIRD